MRRVLLALSLVSSVLLSAGDAWARTNREAFCDPARRCFASEASTCGSGRTCAINTVVDTVCGLTTVGQGRCLAAEDLTCMNTESCLSREAVEPVRVEQSICCRCGLSTARDRCVSFTNVTTCAADTIDRHPSMIAYHNRSGATADSPQVQCDPVQLSEQECLPVAQNGTCQNRAADVVTVFTAQADPNAGPGLIDRASDALTGAVRPPITPNLSVPIPGLTFATPEAAGGTVRVNFLGQYIAAVYRYAVSIVVVVATIMVVYGGFLYLVSPIAGKAAKGKEIIKDALMGTVVLLSAYLILNTVNPELTNLKTLGLEQIIEESTAERGSLPPEEQEQSNASTPSTAPRPSATGPIPPPTNGAPPTGVRERPPANSCATPNFAIRSFSQYTHRPFQDAERIANTARSRRAIYEQAAATQGIPWQLLAVMHYREAGMRENGSVTNGGTLCNRSNTWCPDICRDDQPQTVSLLNDLKCGARIIRHKNARQPFSANDIEAVKRVAAFYGGYTGNADCREVFGQVAARFSPAHDDLSLTTHDCVPAGCRASCTSDYTGSGPVNGGCCQIAVWAPNSPEANARRNARQEVCNLNHSRACLVYENGNKRVYQYNRGEVTPENRCGTWRSERRAGVLTIYSYLVHTLQLR